jgi:hypothetical protein
MAYRGQIVTLPVGLQGFSGSRNPSKMGPGHFSYVENVDIDGGVLVKEGGADKLNATELESGEMVLAGINWSPSGQLHHDVVIMGNGTALKDTGAGTFATSLVTGLSTPTVYPPFFVPAGGESVGATRKLFMCMESDQMQVVSGTANTMADISAPAADWSASFPIFGVLHNLRLWAGGNANDPHRIYYSTLGAHQDFTGAGSGTLSIYPGEGEALVAGISFRGLLLLFKRPRGIYVVDTRDPTVANWQVQKLNSAVGAAGPWCVVQISNDIVILDQSGNFHLMTAVNDFGDINASNIGVISDIPSFMRSEASLGSIQKAVGAWYPSRSKAWFMVPSAGSLVNNMRIMADFSDPQAGPRFLLSRRDIGSALWMRPDASGVDKPTLGDDAGFVWLMDTEDRNKDGVAYDFAFDTSETDFSFAEPLLGAKSKSGQFLEITADLLNNTQLSITPLWDGEPADPISMVLGGGGAALGSFTLDVDELASAGIITKRVRLTGSGRRLKLMVENTTLDDEVRLSEVKVQFTVADERTQDA